MKAFLRSAVLFDGYGWLKRGCNWRAFSICGWLSGSSPVVLEGCFAISRSLGRKIEGRLPPSILPSSFRRSLIYAYGLINATKVPSYPSLFIFQYYSMYFSVAIVSSISFFLFLFIFSPASWWASTFPISISSSASSADSSTSPSYPFLPSAHLMNAILSYFIKILLRAISPLWL